MEAAGDEFRLNLLSRAILGVTTAVGLALIVCAAPTVGVALGPSKAKAPATVRPLDSALDHAAFGRFRPNAENVLP